MTIVTMIAMFASATAVAAFLLLWRQQRISGHFAKLAKIAENNLAERKLTEERYRTLEERFRIIFEGAIDGILLADLESRTFIEGNPAITRMLGYRPEEIPGLRLQDIHPTESLTYVETQFSRQFRGEIQTAENIPVLRKDGSLFYADISASPVHLSNKDYLLGIFRDVTAHRHTEERLRLHGAALASSRDAMVITDLTPAILAVNPAFTEITGYSEEEVLGKNPRILNSGHHDRAFFQTLWASLLETGFWQGEIWNRRKDGETFPEWLSISTVRDENGKATHYVAVATDLSQIRQSEEQIQLLAHYDPLTNLPNRLLLEARLQHSLERAQRQGGLTGVLSIDLDQFKTINDSLGHSAGDELLIAVTKRFQNRLRNEDTLSRLAGDQFVLVLEMLKNCREAEVIARGILSTLEAPFTLTGGHEVYVRASVGIALFPQDGNNPQALLHQADAAVHQAKLQSSSCSRICFYTTELNVRAMAALEMEGALRRALDEGEFLLYYQPKVELTSGRVVGAEALIRWQRPGHGLVPPNDFIPIAERSGLIEAIGSWVAEEACQQLKTWQEQGLPEVRLAINVSARQFRSPFLERTLAALLAACRIKPERLTLELTESMLMEDPGEALTRMIEMKRIGVQLSLDDFGTGYSSLAYLSRFPIDEMKIDRSFIMEMVTDPGAATIATSIIALARKMRLKVVAEGVETPAQLGFLRQHRCDEIQGYFFSPPLPAAEFSELLRQGTTLAMPDFEQDRHCLLIVDDEEDILGLLRQLLADEEYDLLTCTSALAGLELLASQPIQVVLSDQNMPGMNGTDFFRRVKVMYPDTVRMVISGNSDLDTVVQTVNQGGLYKYIGKPWDSDELRTHIRDAFRYYETRIKPRISTDQRT